MVSTGKKPRNAPTRGEVVRAGWPFEGRERRDFLHPPRSFPPAIRRWRKSVVASILANPERFDRVTRDEEVPDVREKFDSDLAHLREVSRILEVVHGNPDHGNHRDPVDELVYIILSRKTREDAYLSAFESLKKAFPCWDDLLEASRDRVRRLIRSSGLVERKCDSLYGALQALVDEFGSCTLDPARQWSDEDLARFLCGLPEISVKSAYCIMMYALDRDVFPVDTHVGRILRRVGIYSELGLGLEGRDHKKLQVVLAELVPPGLRYSLHVNLVAHGRSTCRARSPSCDRCGIRKLCTTWRGDRYREVLESGAPTVVDLFCGAGGLSQGFTGAGFRVELAVDREPAALRTYTVNHPETPAHRVLQRDLAELRPGELKSIVGRRRPDVLIGAPPCQGFSSAGFRSRRSKQGYDHREDSRNDLFSCVVEAAAELRPALVLLENVPGMKSLRRKEGSYIEEAARELEVVTGYRTDIWNLNALEFGIPQDRSRYFIVAAREDVELPRRPPAEYQNTKRRDFDLDALPPVNLDEAIYDLPPVQSGEGTAVSRMPGEDARTDPRSRRYLEKFRILSSAVAEAPLVFNHAARDHNARDIELYGLLAEGEDSVDAVEHHRREDLMRYRRDVFADKYLKLRGDSPCKTIVSHLAKDGNGYVHPRQARALTLREAARVQSFPDDHPFCGSVSDQWIQLGNAVPPVMARAIARCFLDVLERKTTR